MLVIGRSVVEDTCNLDERKPQRMLKALLSIIKALLSRNCTLMTTPDNRRVDWIGFYTSRPFWAGTPLDPPQAMQQQGFDGNFFDAMSAITFDFKTDHVELSICKDGLILIRFPDWEDAYVAANRRLPMNEMIEVWNKYLNAANVFYLLLDAAIIELRSLHYLQLSEITNRDAFRYTQVNGRFMSQSAATESFAWHYQKDRLFNPTDSSGIVRILIREAFDKSVFELCFSRFQHIVSNPTLLSRVSAIAKSLSEYKIGNYPISLVNAWFVCEQEISDRWDRFVNGCNVEFADGSKRINNERKTFLLGHHFTASIKSNLLELNNIIKYEDLKILDKIRNFRNDIAHKNKSCDAAACGEALEIALRLVLEKEAFTFPLNLDISLGAF